MNKMTMFFTEQLQQIVERNYKDVDFDYGKLCELLGLSRSQVYSAFQAANLMSPSIYIRQFRLQKASTLLMETDLWIKEIAYEEGFKVSSHFLANFFDFYGISPRNYREQITNF